MVAPLDGSDCSIYETARPRLKVPAAGANRLLPLDQRFGLHPALSPLLDLYRQQKLALVHAVGLTADTRSHFDAMELIELGEPAGRSTRSGWLARHLHGAAAAPEAALPVMSSQGSPTALLDYPDAVTLSDPADFSLWDNNVSKQAQIAALKRMYAFETTQSVSAAALNRTAQRTLQALKAVAPAVDGSYRPANGAEYGEDGFSASLRSVARMIKLGVGLQAACVDLGGWDTHEYQGESGGYLARLLAELGRSLLAFYTDLDSPENYTAHLSVVVMSEFGRRLNENDSGGTNHGHGSLMLALGGGVNGGRVNGSWPGLHADALYDRSDLAVTTDYPRVLSELLVKRLNNPDLGTIFPWYDGYRGLGIFKESLGSQPAAIERWRTPLKQ